MYSLYAFDQGIIVSLAANMATAATNPIATTGRAMLRASIPLACMAIISEFRAIMRSDSIPPMRMPNGTVKKRYPGSLTKKYFVMSHPDGLCSK